MKSSLKTIDINGLQLSVVPHPQRKYVAIVIADGVATLRVPARYSDKGLRKFVAAHEQWISRTLSRLPAPVPVAFTNGMRLELVGKSYHLDIRQAEHDELQLHDDSLRWRCPYQPNATIIRQRLSLWYREQAQQIILPQVKKFADKMRIEMPKVSFGSARTCLGSCTKKGNIRFTWYLVKAPLAQIDSVVVHELCHLLEFSHSKRFWRQVATFDPNYLQSKKWFAKHTQKLLAW